MHRDRFGSRSRLSLCSTVTCCLSLAVSIGASAQISFQRVYGSYGHSEEGRSVIITPDGYVIAGSAELPTGYSDVYLFKIDSVGTVLWERFYGGVYPDSGYCVQQTSDGGFILTGSTFSFGAGATDVYLIKTDSTGAVLWETTYGSSGSDCGSSVQQTLDDGYIVAGWASPSGLVDAYLLKTDSAGNEVWAKTYGGQYRDEAHSVQETADGGYIVAGKTCSLSSVYSEVYLVRTDSFGDTLWARTPADTGFPGIRDRGTCVTQTSDGGFAVCGQASSLGAGPCLIKTDSLGDLVWAQSYGGDPWDEGRSVAQTSDGGFILTGVREDNVVLIKADSTGDSLWTRTFGHSRDDWGNSVKQTLDGGYIIAGFTSLFDGYDGDIYVIKTDATGFSQRKNARVTAVVEPPGRVFADSIYSVAATVQNLGENTDTFDVLATLDAYADTVRVAGLPPDSIVQVTFQDWQVPPADTTIYKLTVCTDAFLDINPRDDCVEVPVFAYTPYHDGKVTRLILPKDTVLAGSTQSVSALVRNGGDFTESFNVVATIDGYTDTVGIVELPPHTGEQVTFADWLPPGADTAGYLLRICAYVEEDADSTNDCAQRTIFVSENESPLMLLAEASDGANAVPGIDDDDYVLIGLSEPTNTPTLDPTNIDTVLALSSGHSWRDGFKNIGSAEWVSDRALQITLSTTVAPPTVAVGDTITPDGVTITDKWGTPLQSSIVITGSFSPPGLPETVHGNRSAFFSLSQNAPNPFSAATDIKYSVPAAANQARTPVKLTVYDVAGKTVEVLACEDQLPGFYRIRWDAEELPSGIYFYRVQAGELTDTRRMTKIK